MSEGTNVISTNVPAHITARIAARGGAKSAALEAVVSGESYPRISTRASRYRLIDQGVETVIGTELKVIIVAVNPVVSKIWYDKAYSEANDSVRPTCFSNDGVKPDASIENPVSPNCSQCPKNVRGSRITPSGAQSKECNDIRHIAVVPSADPSKVYGLTVPVSAMKAFRVYFKELSQYGMIPEEVVTTLGFDDTASYPKMTFKHFGFVPEKHLKTVEEMGATPETKAIIRVLSGPQAPRLVAPVTAPAASAIAPPAEAPKPEAPTDEPVPVPQTTEVKVEKVKAKAKGADPKPAVAPAQATDAVTALEAELDGLFQ